MRLHTSDRLYVVCMQTVSDPFYISPGPPSELVVSVQPGHALGGQLFAPQPRVTIQDGFGNVVPDSNVPNVTVSLHTPLPVTYTTAGVLDVPTLGGKFLTVPFVNGTATFLDLYINSCVNTVSFS